jgi:hypothetical protein
MEEASVLLQRRLLRDALRKAAIDSTRIYPAQWTTTCRRSVVGFNDATPNPPARAVTAGARRWIDALTWWEDT